MVIYVRVVQKWEELAVKEKASYEQAMIEWKKKPADSHSKYLKAHFALVSRHLCDAGDLSH